MEFTGQIRDGAVVLDDAQELPEGARIRIVVLEKISGGPYSGLLKYSGIVKDLPKDFAKNHDHYLHGQPKK
jgi:hypothetical protein